MTFTEELAYRIFDSPLLPVKTDFLDILYEKGICTREETIEVADALLRICEVTEIVE